MSSFIHMAKNFINFKCIPLRETILMFFCFLTLSCNEVPVIESQGQGRLDSPASMVLLAGTDCAIISNANVNLDQKSGSLLVVNLATNDLLMETLFEIPNFGGEFFIDTTRNRLYIPDHDKALLIYKYSISGTDCDSINFSRLNVSTPEDILRPNGIETDDGPTQALMIPGTSLDDLILVTNQKGSVSMIPADTLKLKDMDDEDKYFGLRLFSASNFENADNFPGRGAGRMTRSAVTGLVYITSSFNNQIYVLNPDNQKIEAMIDLDSISLPTVGMRDIVLDNSTGTEIAYIAHSGLDSVIMLDVSGIIVNSIPYEVVAPPILDIIPVGDGPEDIEMLSSGLFFFVSNQNEDSIYMVDTTLRQVVKKVFLDKAKSPARLILDEPRNTLYSLDFFSNSISTFNATTGIATGSIQ